MWVLCEIMGTPPEDRRHLIQLGDAMLGNTVPDLAGEFTFGEADLSTLFVTSIRAPGTPAEALDGAVYALRPGVRGLEETAYAG